MTKIAFTADWHLRGADLAARRAQLDAMIDACIERDVQLLGVAGDVFDRSNIFDNHASAGAVLAVALRAIRRLSGAGIRVLMIVGNHDRAGAGSEDALHAFDGMDGVDAFRGPWIWAPAGYPAIACVPWAWASERTAEQVIADLTRDPRYQDHHMILMAHVQVAGARMSGSFCAPTKPGEWQISRQFLETLPVDHVALGDFHARQDLAGGRGSYIGALCQCNFGEEGNPAGFEIYETETGVTEWIELDAAPRHWTVRSAAEAALVGRPGDHIKLRYDGAMLDRVEARRLEAAGVIVEQVLDRVERIQRADVPAGILADRHAMIRLWAGAQNPPISAERLAGAIAAHDRLFSDKEVAI